MKTKRGVACMIIGVASLLTVSCAKKAQNTQQKELILTHKALVAQYFDQWKNEGACFFELLDEDAIWIVAGRSPVSGTYHGKQDFMDHAVQPILAQLATPLQPELLSLTADEQYVWLHFRAKATAINGQSYVNTYVWKMQFKDEKIISGVAFLDTYELAELMNLTKETNMNKTMEETKGYIGMWVTEDGHIRQELLPNNRYDEARGNRKSAYQGKYKVTGNHIDYVDDTGFSADGEFVDEKTLHHGGYIFYKEE